MTVILRIIFSLIKPILGILIFTGLYVPTIFMIIYFKWIKPNSNSIITDISDVIFILTVIIAIGIFLKNIVRIFNPNFRYSNLLPKKKTKPYEKVDKRLKTNKGIIFGKVGNKYITKPQEEDGHTLVVGGAGSGKSSCIAIPTLLSWTSSVFAIDIKGELSETVKGYRKNMKVFNPSNINSICYNPYEILNSSNNRVQGAKEIAQSIIPIPDNVKDPFWKQSAQSLLVSSILHFSSIGMDFPETCKSVQSTPVKELVELLSKSDDENARMFATQFICSDDKVLGSVFAELSNNIMVFATDSDLQRVLRASNNTISIKDLEFGNDIFIRIAEDKMEQWKGLLTLITSQFLKEFEKRQEKNKLPILFLLDEFARLGKIEGIVNGLATLRSKNIHICILTQSLAQLDVIYGKDQRKVIADNCSYKTVLKATDPETQEYFSKLVGTFDKDKISNSSNFSEIGLGKGRGISETTEEKRIIKPEEFAYLENPIVFTPLGFFRPKKIPYYDEKELKNKIKK